MSQQVLLKEYQALQKEKWVKIDIDEDNIHSWQLALMVVNPDSLYYGGYFKARMSFPKDYPYSPPDFRFTPSLWHPNIYPDGRLCISILHAPGEDITSGETAGERWSPVQRVETVLISILSLLDDAEISSPANIDASVMLRDRKNEFEARVKEDVEASKQNIPKDFVMPTHESTKPVIEKPVDDDFWADSDAEVDFDDFDDTANGSESDEALNNDSEDEDDFDEDKTELAEEHEENLDSEMTDAESEEE